jgi:glycosyltransferase A (GT-A) superfamily protein (DUF2064 family)
MVPAQQSVAVLIFARNSQEDALQKRIPAGTALFDYLTEKTQRIAEKTNFAVLTSSKQRGNSFEERFIYALEDAFKQGYEHVIAIGNDSPKLNTQHLKAAGEALENNTAVLGPSTDGGAYLIGISRQHFDPAALRALPWQKASLFRALNHYFEARTTRVAQLEYLVDLDSLKDIEHFIHFSVCDTHLHTLLVRLVLSKRIKRSTSSYQIPVKRTESHYNKGSPYSLS